jgi:hypothetical protein
MISGTVTNSSITGIDNYTGLAAGGTRQSNKFYTSVTESGNTGNYTTTTTNNVIDTVTDVTAEQNGEEEETA